jgi:MFS family permease
MDERERPNGRSLLSRVTDEFSFIRGNFLVILIGWLLVDATREMAYTYYPLYVQALGGSAFTVGLIGSVSMIVEALGKVPGGYIADKYRRKRLIVVMTFMASIGYLVLALAPTWHFILLGAVMSSLCWIYTPAFDSIVMESLPEDKRGTGYSLVNLITRVSTTPSPLIAGVLFTTYGLVGSTRIGFLVVAASFLIASILRTRLTETHIERPEIDARELVKSFSGTHSFIEGFGVWRDVPRSLTALLGVEMLSLIPNVVFNITLIFYMVQELGITELQLSYLGTIIGVSMILLAVPAGKVIDRLGRKKPLLFGYALTFLALFTFLDASFNLLLLLTPLIALLNVTFYTAIQALYADLIPENARGRVSGSKDFFRLAAVSIGQLAGGFIYDNVSHTLPTYIYMASMVPVFVLTALFVDDPEKA